MADDEEEESPTEAEGETEDEEEHKKSDRRKRKKKGNWKNIGTTPRSYATYPCECRWRRKFPRGPCIKYNQVRWVVLPLSDRIAQLALPLLRRLLALWLEFGDKFPPEMRERLLGFLMEKYGLTREFLEKILEEARAAREEAEKGGKKGGKKKKKGRRKRKRGKKKKKKKKEKKVKEKKEKEPKRGKEKQGGLGFKRRKPGKLPFDWPYKTGSKFLLMCISYLSRDPDEDFNSRATEYFDVQSMGILEEVCRFMDMPIPDPERPTQCGETLVIMALNMSDWIAKYVIAPAQEIPDDKVEEYLELRGVVPKPKKEKKGKKDKKSGDAKEKKGKKEKAAPVVPPPPEEPAEPPRVWDELKSPVYVPPKTRISKRKPLQTDEDEEGYSTEADANAKEEGSEEEGIPRWRKQQTLDDVKKEFLEYVNWYNPWAPEFMYLGPKIMPEGVEMFKIWDQDSDEVPEDLRVLNWNIMEHGYADSYSFIPSPVPQYYPCLRPLRPVRLEDLERSGIPKEFIKQNLRFFSPWYIMSKPLRISYPSPSQEQQEHEADVKGQTEGEEEEEEGAVVGDPSEAEENFEDEMLTPSSPPEVKDSVWGDHKMKEQLEILCHLLHLTVSVPQLTIEHVFELLEEFCDAVECAESDENPSDENKQNLKKRTIILERYYLSFFGKKFRDYNDRTPYYMRTVCKRFAYYIQLLYEYTARTLWELQSRPNPPDPIETVGEEPDDPQALQDWDEWLAWLIRLTKTCDDWAGWISETVEEAEKKATKKKGEYIDSDGKVQKLTKEEWFSWKEEVEEKIHAYRSSKRQYSKESPYFLEKAKEILPVKHRPIKRFGREMEEEEEGDWEDVAVMEDTADEDEYPAEGEVGQVTDTEDTTLGDSEYEDLTEND